MAKVLSFSPRSSQLSIASEILRHALTSSEGTPSSDLGPAFTEDEESLFRRREDDVISGKVATRSLAEVLAGHPARLVHSAGSPQ